MSQSGSSCMCLKVRYFDSRYPHVWVKGPRGPESTGERLWPKVFPLLFFGVFFALLSSSTGRQGMSVKLCQAL
jgi:hypothetical protein